MTYRALLLCPPLLFLSLSLRPLWSQTPQDRMDQVLDRIIAREHEFLQVIRERRPLIETYVQENSAAGGGPVSDHYFLGRFRLSDQVSYGSLVERPDTPALKNAKPGSRASKMPLFAFLPRGFAQMAAIDLRDFNRQTYHFEYVRREFLGEVRCLVFDVTPINRRASGRFLGRIWVEDQGYAIVRFNGVFFAAPSVKGQVPERFFHFDSWRVNASAALWVPAQIYIEEQGAEGNIPRFRAQSRIWDYDAIPSGRLDELTNVLVESQAPVKDKEGPPDFSPLEGRRAWERQAEENLVARLEKGGLLAPPGPVDQVVNTVLENLIVSGNLNVEARARVLLTTPMETFAIGHTIVISRGLIDVLPDEASLAVILAGELSHIALGHPTPTQFAFNDQTMLSDAEMLQRFRFQRSPEEVRAAGEKAIQLIHASPYKSAGSAGLFLKALASRRNTLAQLLDANLGDRLAEPALLDLFKEWTAAAPALDDRKLEQIPALPLGSRIRLNPWNNQIALVKTRPLALLSPSEKMPFEIAPIELYLTHASPGIETRLGTAEK